MKLFLTAISAIIFLSCDDPATNDNNGYSPLYYVSEEEEFYQNNFTYSFEYENTCQQIIDAIAENEIDLKTFHITYGLASHVKNSKSLEFSFFFDKFDISGNTKKGLISQEVGNSVGFYMNKQSYYSIAYSYNESKDHLYILVFLFV